MPEFYLLGGPNGAGKSTIADKRYAGKATIVNGDRLISQYRSQHKTQTVPLDIPRQINDLITGLMKDRKDLLVESNLITPAAYEGYLKLARDYGYTTHLVFVALDSLDELSLRIDQRVQLRKEHFVPPHTVKENYAAGMRYLPQFLKRFDHAYLIDNSSLDPELLVRFEGGKIADRKPKLPAWMYPRQMYFIMILLCLLSVCP